MFVDSKILLAVAWLVVAVNTAEAGKIQLKVPVLPYNLRAEVLCGTLGDGKTLIPFPDDLYCQRWSSLYKTLNGSLHTGSVYVRSGKDVKSYFKYFMACKVEKKCSEEVVLESPACPDQSTCGGAGREDVVTLGKDKEEFKLFYCDSKTSVDAKLTALAKKNYN